MKNRLSDWRYMNVRTEDDIEEIFGRGGAMRPFPGREKGLARFIGVTGHQDPAS